MWRTARPSGPKPRGARKLCVRMEAGMGSALAHELDCLPRSSHPSTGLPRSSHLSTGLPRSSHLSTPLPNGSQTSSFQQRPAPVLSHLLNFWISSHAHRHTHAHSYAGARSRTHTHTQTHMHTHTRTHTHASAHTHILRVCRARSTCTELHLYLPCCSQGLAHAVRGV